MMTKRIFGRVANFAAVLLLAASSATALAGDFYEKDGVAIKGYDPVAYFTDKKPIKGSPTIKPNTGDRYSISSRKQTAMPSRPILPSTHLNTMDSARSARPADTKRPSTRPPSPL